MPSNSAQPENSIDRLAKLTGSSWRNLAEARRYTTARRLELHQVLDELDSSDTSIVVFGSLARDEASPGSDTDWTLLVDGIADPLHVSSAQEIARRLEKIRANPPGKEGTFGDLAFSHPIVHWIGGEDDSNANTTRRILLLLESKPLGKREAWDRVLNNLLSRYLKEDLGLWDTTKRRGVPLFLLNDIARYWRIMVVDFAYKQRARGNKGYALRNIKLGLSRKLIFASGLLACFSCRMDFSEEQWREFSETKNPQPLIEHLRSIFEASPLEIVARALVPLSNKLDAAKRLFDAYDRFIELLADDKPGELGKSPREHLNDLPVNELEKDSVYVQAREIRRDFQGALEELFLKPGTELYDLTIKFGVF
jgi:predicted nucleotidyltransferase